MAESKSRKRSAAKKRSNSRSGGRSNAKISTKRTYNRKKTDVNAQTSLLKKEIIIWITIAVGIILMLCNFGVGKNIGNFIAGIFFGICGLWNYVFPFFLIFLVVFFFVNKGNMSAYVKFGAFILASFMVCTFIELLSGPFDPDFSLIDYYRFSSEFKGGGGFIGGLFTKLLCSGLGKAIAFVIVIIVFIICIVLISEKSILKSIGNGSRKAYSHAKESARNHADRIREERMMHQSDKYNDYDEYADNEDIFEEKNEIIDVEDEYSDDKNEIIDDYTNSFSEDDGSKYIDLIKDVNDENNGGDDFIRDIAKETGRSRNYFFSLEKNYQEELNKENAFLESQRSELLSAESKIDTIDIPAFESSEVDMTDKFDEEIKDEPQKSDDRSFFDLNNNDFYDINGYIEPGQFVVNNKNGDGSPSYIDSLMPDIKDSIDDIPPIRPVKQSSGAVKSNTVSVRNTVTSKSADITPVIKKSSLSTRSASRTNAQTASVSQTGFTRDVVSEYKFPSIELLDRAKSSGKGMNQKDLQETADKLQKTLESFGVMTHVVNVSCGPSVTRYELAPETGIKVSRIVNLADDIKLNLAAADIRIEAPIPGKSAVGIEVPNSENKTVTLRELIESETFVNFNSKITFGVGLDLSGRAVVADIYKMPHLLIGGATGSGKSVCINTLIISILFKAKPDEVKFIMIDPKMIELNLYNGIPHLIIPVVTDPRKAAGALQWAVSEMTRRYTLFAALSVRDLKSYNKKIETIKPDENGIPYEKLPQIVIVVDEFADLMMVAKGNVEDSVCRLAQLARAAGIHLILATQRPSVDVITGIIKNNLPSRIALAVTSGVDSRTIIDMVGAEKLLGKGDMLFYPSGYPKPVRVQGAYVSEEEVERVVEFVKSQNGDADYDNNVADQVEANANSSSKDSNSKSNVNKDIGQVSSDTGQIVEDDGRDVYFKDAARFIVDKEKASIGSLQRVFKIGFNRAARIMDQLCEAGIVGEEEGTKPRKILMNMNQLEEFLNPDNETDDYYLEGEEE